jgi:hypothetical protein
VNGKYLLSQKMKKAEQGNAFFNINKSDGYYYLSAHL